MYNLQPLDASGDILQASDDLSRVINSYKKIVEGQPINGDSEEPPSTAGHSESGERLSGMMRMFLHFYIKIGSLYAPDVLLNSAAAIHLPLCHTHSTDTTDTLIDLAGLDTPSPPQPAALPSLCSNPIPTNLSASPIPVLPPPPKRLGGSHGSQGSSPSHPPLDKASTALSLLDDELLSLGSISSLQRPELC